MAHEAQQQFCRDVKARFSTAFSNVRVLEVGSRNINGSVRAEFDKCEYTGVDCESGKDVDVVCLAHEFAAEPDSFDTVCALEVFEHDPYAEQTVAMMVRVLRPGGLMFMTCAGDGRREHGTARTGKRYGPDANYYRNVSEDQFKQWLDLDANPFDDMSLVHNADTCDLYFYGIKAKANP